MNRNTINNIYKWTLRFYYFRTLLLGVGMLCFSFTLIITDYKIAERDALNMFFIIFLGFLGLIFIIVGLLQKAHTEIGIRAKKHEEEID